MIGNLLNLEKLQHKKYILYKFINIVFDLIKNYMDSYSGFNRWQYIEAVKEYARCFYMCMKERDYLV